MNKGNLGYEYDQVHIICPVYEQGTFDNETEKLIIYNVSKAEYETCRITNANPRIIAVCDKPQRLMYFTLTFRPFTPQPGGLEFLPGHDYYFISTSSKDDLHRRIGGRCSTNNMKVVFKVCCGGGSDQQQQGGGGGSGVIKPTPDNNSASDASSSSSGNGNRRINGGGGANGNNKKSPSSAVTTVQPSSSVASSAGGGKVWSLPSPAAPVSNRPTLNQPILQNDFGAHGFPTTTLNGNHSINGGSGGGHNWQSPSTVTATKKTVKPSKFHFRGRLIERLWWCWLMVAGIFII